MVGVCPGLASIIFLFYPFFALKHITIKVEQFRVQRSGLKNTQPAPIQGILKNGVRA
jgi:hypothetical protein